MKWFARAFQVMSPADQCDAEIGDTLLHLSALLRDAEAQGAHFRPAARLAREALKAIHWR
jgi:hypothetical protein